MKRYAKTNGHAVRNAFEFLRTYICFDSDQTRLCVSTAAKRGEKKQNTCKIKSHLKSISLILILLQFKTVMICSG